MEGKITERRNRVQEIRLENDHRAKEGMALADKDAIGLRLKTLFDKHGNKYNVKFGHLEVGRIIDKSPQSIGYMTRGQNPPSVLDVAGLAMFYGITTDEIILGKKPGDTQDMAEELEKLRQENATLRKALEGVEALKTVLSQTNV